MNQTGLEGMEEVNVVGDGVVMSVITPLLSIPDASHAKEPN